MTKKRSQVGEIWHRLCKSPTAVAGLCFILLLILCAVFAPLIAPYDYAKQNLAEKFIFPCPAHWFGTDGDGFDVFSRTIASARRDLPLAVIGLLYAAYRGTPPAAPSLAPPAGDSAAVTSGLS